MDSCGAGAVSSRFPEIIGTGSGWDRGVDVLFWNGHDQEYLEINHFHSVCCPDRCPGMITHNIPK